MNRAPAPELTAAAAPLVYDLAGRRLGLLPDDPRWQGALAARYAPFAVDASPDLLVELRATGVPERDVDLLWRLAQERPQVRMEGQRLEATTPSIRLRLDLESGGTLAGPLHRAPVDLLSRLVLPLLLPRGLVLHAALVCEEGRAWLCSGPSGSGKSTLARLMGSRARCDELAVAHRGDHGWQGRALPFWHGRPGGGALQGLYLLRHGARDHRRRMAPEEAFRRLSPEALWPWHSPAHTAGAFELLSRLVAEVPCWELAFRPTPEVWNVLAAATRRGD